MSFQFLQTLYTPYGQEEGLLCEVRCLSKNRADQPVIRYFGLTHLDKAAEFAQSQKSFYDVYMGVLPRSRRAAPGQAGLDKDVQNIAWLWCDLDRGSGSDEDMIQFLQHVKSRLPAPRMIVFSGSGGVHLYWQLPFPLSLAEEEARDLVQSILRRVPISVGNGPNGIHADKSCQNFSRILRLPKTLSHKHSPPVSVFGSLVHSYDILSLEEWDKVLHWLPLPAYKTRPRMKVADPSEMGAGVPAGLLRWAETGYPEGNRHHDIVGAAAWLRRDTDLPESVAFDLLKIKAQNSGGRRQITDEEVEKAWIWAG